MAGGSGGGSGDNDASSGGSVATLESGTADREIVTTPARLRPGVTDVMALRVGYEKLNRIQPVLGELTRRSTTRLTADADYAYVREDIEQYKKNIADKTVSLNEAQRIKEREEIEGRKKARQQELKARKEPEEKVYEITLKNAALPGLPPPTAKMAWQPFSISMR